MLSWGCVYLVPQSKPLSDIGIGIGCLHAFSLGRGGPAECAGYGSWVRAGKKERKGGSANEKTQCGVFCYQLANLLSDSTG